MRAIFGVLEHTQGLHLQAKCHQNVIIVSASGGQETQFWANFDFWGLLYRPLLPKRAKFGVLHQTHGVRLRAKFRLDWFILLPSVGKKPYFFNFFGHRHLVVSPTGSSLKLNMGAQLQTFPYLTASKSLLYSNAFMVKSGTQSLTFKSMTNKQTNKFNVFGRRGGG